MTDVAQNSRLFAATSTTCSTLLCVFYETSFSTHRHLAYPVSWPIRHPTGRHKLCSHKLRDRHTSQVLQQDARYIRCTHACGLFSWIMASGLLAFSSRQFAPTINHRPLFAPYKLSYFSLLSEARCSSLLCTNGQA